MHDACDVLAVTRLADDRYKAAAPVVIRQWQQTAVPARENHSAVRAPVLAVSADSMLLPAAGCEQSVERDLTRTAPETVARRLFHRCMSSAASSATRSAAGSEPGGARSL